MTRITDVRTALSRRAEVAYNDVQFDINPFPMRDYKFQNRQLDFRSGRSGRKRRGLLPIFLLVAIAAGAGYGLYAWYLGQGQDAPKRTDGNVIHLDIPAATPSTDDGSPAFGGGSN